MNTAQTSRPKSHVWHHASRLPLPAILYLLSSILSPIAHAATFTSAVTISETDSTYDGQNIILNRATVTINGAHRFNSLLLTNNAVFTHSLCTATGTHELELIVTNQIIVSANSRMT